MIKLVAGRFKWSRPIPMSGLNEIEITWKVPADSADIEPGFYRIRHFGYYKPALLKAPRPYRGSTNVFQVLIIMNLIKNKL